MSEPWTLQRAIEFALDLEENEEHMGEGAAMALTLEQYGHEWGDQNDVLLMLPDGAWWLLDERLTDNERETLRKEYEARDPATNLPA